jgi:APA family basic amino acid/polyamine antiporter
LGSLNGMITTGPRVYYAMARDGLFFSALGRTSSKYNTPIIALAIQGLWAIVLSLSGSYQQLLTDVIFTAWIFYGLTVGGVIVLRKTNPSLVRPYRVPGFPWIPLLFCLAAAGISVSTIVKSPVRSLLGIGLILTGVPVYLLFRRHSAIAIEKFELAQRP